MKMRDGQKLYLPCSLLEEAQQNSSKSKYRDDVITSRTPRVEMERQRVGSRKICKYERKISNNNEIRH